MAPESDQSSDVSTEEMLRKVAALNAGRHARKPSPAQSARALRRAAVLGAVIVALVVALALVWRLRSGEGAAHPATTQPRTLTRPSPARGEKTTTAPATTTASQRPATPPPARKAAALQVTASRGACWVLARAGGAQGRVLYDAVVQEGSTVEVRARRLWVRFGAAGYVDLVLNGRPLQLGSTGTVDVLLTAAGVQG